MKKILVLALIAILCSCKTAYVPNTVNVPLFDGPGQVRISGDNTGNIQFAASLGSKFGVMANGMWRKDGESTDALSGKGSFIEAGIGGFSDSRGSLRYEVYAGAGVGKATTIENNKSFEIEGARFFFQPSIGVHNRIFELAFTPRLVAGKYRKPTTDFTNQQLLDNKFIDLDKTTWVFAEPAVTARVGYQWIKLQLQLGKSIKLIDKPIGYTKEFNSIGLIFDLGRGYR